MTVKIVIICRHTGPLWNQPYPLWHQGAYWWKCCTRTHSPCSQYRIFGTVTHAWLVNHHYPSTYTHVCMIIESPVSSYLPVSVAASTIAHWNLHSVMVNHLGEMTTFRPRSWPHDSLTTLDTAYLVQQLQQWCRSTLQCWMWRTWLLIEEPCCTLLTDLSKVESVSLPLQRQTNV